MCEAKNAVGKAQCKYALRAYNRKSMISSSNFALNTLTSQRNLFFLLHGLNLCSSLKSHVNLLLKLEFMTAKKESCTCLILKHHVLSSSYQQGGCHSWGGDRGSLAAAPPPVSNLAPGLLLP